MERHIIELVDKCARTEYAKFTPVKKTAYRFMLYAGVQVTLNGCTAREIATELDISEPVLSRYVKEWRDRSAKGDPVVSAIDRNYHRLPMNKRYRYLKEREAARRGKAVKKVLDTHEEGSILESVAAPPKPKTKKVLGFVITPEDEARAQFAMRQAVLFMETYGAGEQPRVGGECFPAGTNPNAKSEGRWLNVNSASLYCGCKREVIENAGREGLIERRPYTRSSHHIYYEYEVESLNQFARKLKKK